MKKIFTDKRQKVFYNLRMDNSEKNTGLPGLKAQLAFRILWSIAAIVASACTFTDHITSLGGDGRPPALFFTSWSVWLACLVALTSLASTVMQLRAGKNCGYNRLLPLLKFCATIMIIATFAVSAFVLPDKIWMASYWTFGSAAKHFVLPLITIADEILFHPHHHYRASYPLFGGLVPLLYWVVLIIRNVAYRTSMGGAIPQEKWGLYYPYGFTNFDNGHTLKGLCLLLLGIGAGLILIGCIFWLCDKFSKTPGSPKKKFSPGVDESDMSDFIHYLKK